MKKSDRVVFKSKHPGGKIVEIDISSAEPRVALSLFGKVVDGDVYEDVIKKAGVKITRADAKVATLSALYGASHHSLKSKMSNPKDAIRNTKVNNTRLVDLFGLQDVDMAKPAIFRQTMTPWIKSNLKIIDRTVRTGILQGADTQAIADQIAGVMITGVKKRGVLDPATKLFTEGKDAYTQIKAQAKAVARTAVQDMNRQVNEQVWDEQTFSSDLRWEWVAAFDSRTCPVCAPLDNILRKDRKSFPEWPVHVNCRCQVVLVDPEDTDARAGIDISPEEDGYDRPGGREKPGRKYKSKISCTKLDSTSDEARTSCTGK